MLFWGRWDRLKAGLLAAVLAGLALLPVYRMHQKALAPERYARGTEETILYSAAVESFLATSALEPGLRRGRPTPSGRSARTTCSRA